ncbi:g11938 [Coccomyxa viridis]|uniref:G11938 protein n=1 Tax=Coccomyxa viridis TaxID=1274662 RepID=A0ABP1GBS4_9CHLO
MKVVDKMNESIKAGKTFFSFEFFPPRTDEGVENLFDRQDRMASFGPTFCDITWGAGGTTADLTLDIAAKMQNMVCVETMMHLTCTNMPQSELESALDKVKSYGIQNILALRGDPPKGQDTFEVVEGGFSCALDLVKYIRNKYGEYFGITVAGYPEAHPDAIVSDAAEMDKIYWNDLHYLKEKIEAGGEVIITQLFYDVDRFVKFVKDCRGLGITVPIVPGIMPIMTYGGFKRMTSFCKTAIPQDISDTLEGIKDNDEAVKAFGIDLGVKMCKRLLEEGTPGLHMYTLNLESAAVGILEQLGLINKKQIARTLPWRPAATSKRQTEQVRPIFWSNRPRAYLKRTSDWDSYPAGRWGNAASPAYGTLSDYQFMRRHTGSTKRAEKAKEAWGASLNSLQDVYRVFTKYTSGTGVSVLPWSEMDSLQLETGYIKDQLVALNRKGFLTINSQPGVNGACSTDPKVGWGGPNGYVYQKAYVEFFTSPENFRALEPKLKAASSITYMAVNAKGDMISNVGPTDVNAVTWGVFPAKEIVQPTVVDPQSFAVWKDEAFGLWTSEWGALYEKGSRSSQIIDDIASTWYLVSVVDNDFIHGNLFGLLTSEDIPAAPSSNGNGKA